MLWFCAPLGTPAINLHTIAYKWLKTKRGKKACSGNIRQHYWKKQYSVYPRKRMPQIRTQRFKLIFLAGLLFSSLSKVWGLLHHWRLWLPTTNRTASQEDEPNKLPNSLSVIWSHCRPYLVGERKKKRWWDCFFVYSRTPAAVFLISPVFFFFRHRSFGQMYTSPEVELTTEAPLCLAWMYETYPAFEEEGEGLCWIDMNNTSPSSTP